MTVSNELYQKIKNAVSQLSKCENDYQIIKCLQTYNDVFRIQISNNRPLIILDEEQLDINIDEIDEIEENLDSEKLFIKDFENMYGGYFGTEILFNILGIKVEIM